MYKVAIPLLVMAVSGCTTPPLALPDAQGDYHPPAPYRTAKGRPCEIIGPNVANPNGKGGIIESAARKAYTRGCDYAGYIDSAKNFGARADQATLGLVTGAGVGALTNTHSDFIKAFGALAGLSLGSKLYVNPKAQMATYAKAAIAAQCMGDSLSDLRVIVTPYEAELEKISELEQEADAFAANLEALNYTPGSQKIVIDSTEPKFIAEIFILTKNAKQDAENKKQALRFVNSAHRLTNANLRAIHAYIVASLNEKAFDIDAATKKIAATSLPTTELINQIKTAAEARKSTLGARITKTDTHEVGILQKLVESESKPIPYADIIRVNNEYTACMVELNKSSESEPN
ncbi:hypothetical protein ACNKH9_23200 [Metapseudomonas otitidis]|uniref:hypothetical protein n=1 Tax=Metapseudomonas otitidis TaxID=319939 RepID=UPI003A863B3E